MTLSRMAPDPPAAVAALAPSIRAAAADIERERRLPPALVRALAQAGLFRLLVPRRYGGAEAEPATLLHVVEALAAIDASVAWCVANGGLFGLFAGCLPDEAARTIFAADPLGVCAGFFGPNAAAVAVEGGWRLTGRWPFASGVGHATWVFGGARLYDGKEPRLTPTGVHLSRLFFFPAASCEVIDTWDSVGLRGTGSHDVAVSDLVVPAARSLSFREPPRHDAPLYRMPVIALGGLTLSVVTLGAARRALEAFKELAGAKTPSASRALLRERSQAQMSVGQAEGLLRSARALAYATLDDVWRIVCAGGALDMETRAGLRLAAAQAASAAVQAVDLTFTAAGGTSVYGASPLQGCWRDVHTAAQHITLQPTNYELVGQALLGLDMRAGQLAADDQGQFLPPAVER